MALTRIRAQQISDIDYKQAVRAITVSNVTLAGGAPNTVDGVNLIKGDRILVAGQDTGSQNGLYDVATLGTGSNGTWTRTTDGNETGEIEAGMLVMVTEGTVYKDTLWKLTTNNPIVVGTTALTFELNTKFGFGNIYANGTGVIATEQSDVLTLTAGENMVILGNATSKTITFSVGGTAAYGNANVASYGEAGWAGNIIPAANITYSLGNSNQRWKDIYLGNSSIYLGNVVLSADATQLQINGSNAITSSAGGNISVGNISTTGTISATGNITSAGTIKGVNIDSTNADLAERYLADADYAPGTVVVFGGANEITQSTTYADSRIAGVISTAPAYCMNVGADGLAVALQGRVPCRVVGTIRKGDLITSSGQPGLATRLESGDWVPGCVIGKALSDHDDTEEGIIEVVVGRL